MSKTDRSWHWIKDWKLILGRQILHVDDIWVNENKRDCNKEEEKSLKKNKSSLKHIKYFFFSNIIHYFSVFLYFEVIFKMFVFQKSWINSQMSLCFWTVTPHDNYLVIKGQNIRLKKCLSFFFFTLLQFLEKPRIVHQIGIIKRIVKITIIKKSNYVFIFWYQDSCTTVTFLNSCHPKNIKMNFNSEI